MHGEEGWEGRNGAVRMERESASKVQLKDILGLNLPLPVMHLVLFPPADSIRWCSNTHANCCQ